MAAGLPARPDIIKLTGISAVGYHGVLEQERHDGQRFIVDVALHTDIRPAAAGDDLTKTANYAELADQVEAIITGEALQLIESGMPWLPDSDFKRQSLFDLGLGAMFSGEMEYAARAFTAALALAWKPDDRATLHRNRGKARMLAGQLLGAVADFRAAVQLGRGVEVMDGDPLRWEWRLALD
jgi:hypothetical protein